MNVEGIREAQYFVLDTRGALCAPIPAPFGRGSERDRSGTTREVHEMHGAGDGADSPTRAAEGGEAARPNY